VSPFTDKMFANARISANGMVTGEPHHSLWRSWREVHERARRIAGGLAAAGVGPGDAVSVLAGAPEEIDPTAVEDLCNASAPFGLDPGAILPAYGMAETTVAVSFSTLGAGLSTDDIDADLLSCPLARSG
jgi:non-ribosomal peptide synthetase component F